MPRGVLFTPPAVVAAAPIIVALFVCATRIRDRYHYTDDVSVGFLIGTASALAAFAHHSSQRRRVELAADKHCLPSLLVDGAPNNDSEQEVC